MASDDEDMNMRNSNSNGLLPNIKGKSNEGSPALRKSIQGTKERTHNLHTPSSFLPEQVDELKKENTALRITLQELQAQVLQFATKGRPYEKPVVSNSNQKGIETTLLRANTKIFKLEGIIKQKDEKIHELMYEKKLTDNSSKSQGKNMETLLNEKSILKRAVQELQGELESIKKNTIRDLIDEIQNLKVKVQINEKKSAADKQLIKKQLQAIKLLDEKNLELSKSKKITLNPLYDSTKRNDLYKQKNAPKAETKVSAETIEALNLAFDSDTLFERLVDEQNKDLEQEELKKKGMENKEYEEERAKTEWESEYKSLRGAFIDARMDFEKVDIATKEEIYLLSRRLNELEERYLEKSKDYDLLVQVLSNNRAVSLEKNSMKSSPRVKRKPGRPTPSNQESVTTKQPSYQEVMKEFEIKAPETDREKVIVEAEFEQSQREEAKRQEEQGLDFVKLGQFNNEGVFDDTHELARHLANRIDAITIWSDKKSLLGIQVKYETKNGVSFEGKKHVGDVIKSGYKKEPWQLDEDDVLAQVRGAVAMTHGIMWLEFVTRKGVVMKYGNPEIGQESFKHEFKDGEIPVLVSGSFSVRERGTKPAKLNLSGLGFKILKDGEVVQADEKEKTFATEPKGQEEKHDDYEREEEHQDAQENEEVEEEVKSSRKQEEDDGEEEEEERNEVEDEDEEENVQEEVYEQDFNSEQQNDVSQSERKEGRAEEL